MDSTIKNTYKKMESHTYNEDLIRLYQMREKAMLDYNSGINHARREGRQEGIAIGKQRGVMKAIKLLKEGKSIEDICWLFNVDLTQQGI
jgi:predicted transposase/invertase (TIGR01784 family)